MKHVEQYIIKQVSSSWSTIIQITRNVYNIVVGKTMGHRSRDKLGGNIKKDIN